MSGSRDSSQVQVSTINYSIFPSLYPGETIPTTFPTLPTVSTTTPTPTLTLTPPQPTIPVVINPTNILTSANPISFTSVSSSQTGFPTMTTSSSTSHSPLQPSVTTDPRVPSKPRNDAKATAAIVSIVFVLGLVLIGARMIIVRRARRRRPERPLISLPLRTLDYQQPSLDLKNLEPDYFKPKRPAPVHQHSK
ncbi:hypothetical protein CROQUDRAFT_132583 [Cronartium quercuum f. sp. fusiforme G11]|uniref:Uncharacterized protein n=1 Tax=Cronartium quercuum f. sp. fusiforme G11 TaxID=708437 RepID=A0A9P6NHX6_9BASI|nr:hypothetical protein CROQUDRAFT_132583 [Cronartium quercuum f. sp. fusiforme G11]